MITGLKPKALLYRDGTSQSQRLMDALDPAYISIDERTIGDLLSFAQQYGNELTFFDENNNPSGTWEAFLLNEPDSENLSIDEKIINRKRWINEILSYIDNPEKFSGEDEKLRKFSRPHLVLFISFLRLLGHVKDQLNTLTKKHLDFFYIEVLGLNKKKPVPDVVNVIVELAKDVNELLVEKGTELYAGKDKLGKDLIYTTEKSTVINRARIENIKTLYVEKNIITLSEARINNVKTKADGFTKMFELALGDPDVGDDLPLYQNQKVDYSKLLSFYTQLNTSNTSNTIIVDYISKSLFLSDTDFKKIIATCNNINATVEDWSAVDSLLVDAYKEKVKWNRKEVLRKIREAETDPAAGFYKMFEFALGDPDPSDKLPIYKAAPANLETIYADLNSADPLKKEASNYIREELLLSENDFKSAIEVYKKKNPEVQDWTKVYADLEVAQRKKRNVELPSPVAEEWVNIYSIKDAKASAFRLYAGEEESSLRFNTFGKGRRPEELTNVEAATIGFAVSSPQLELKEGKRSIVITAFFKNDVLIDADEIAGILTGTAVVYQPFLFFVSSEKEWVSINPLTVQFGNLVITESTDVYTAQINQSEITKTAGNDFISKNDEGKFIIWDDGTIYKILGVKSAVTVLVKNVGKVNKHAGIKKYNDGDIVFNVLRVELQLMENDLPLVAAKVIDDVISIKSDNPVVAMVLNQIPVSSQELTDDDNVAVKFRSLYQQFKNLQLETVKLDVSVTGIKSLTLQNDLSVLNYKKPFEPFGFNPQTGNSLYFSNSEISQKQLQTLSLKFEWMNPPKKFADYYDSYWKLKTSNPKLDNTTIDQYEIKSNNDFTATVKLVDNNITLSLQSVALFDSGDAKNVNAVQVNVADLLAQNYVSYSYNRRNITTTEDDVTDWERYYVLELGSPDFQHTTYPALLTKQALINANPATQTADEKSLRSLQLNPPYTPKIKSLTLGYTASFTVNFNGRRNQKGDNAYHISAFGYKQLSLPDSDETSQNTYFLPYYKNEGELYIGIAQLQPPQNVSLLFQMAEGSADPDLEPPAITWSYLSNNEWLLLKGDNVVSDSTNGLLNTGIIEFYIPADATNDNTVIGRQVHWLRATISTNNGAISDTVDIFTQGISAAFTNHDNADDHLLTLLPPDSIKETVVRKREIKKITQPYTSSKGKPGEVDAIFYNRVSERLRHKNRALTMWDYERIVLEQFPSVYKVKCLPAELSINASVAGRVDVVVIPDIRGKLPFNPFQPKVPPETIKDIQQYLEQRMPAFSNLKVKNPSYLQVKVRFAVKIKSGYNEDFFTRRLEEELRRYLAPWAYDDGADITIGGKIYANVIVNFLAEKSYVEYVAGIKLFQSEDGKVFRDVRTINNGENVVYAQQPDVILVSALEHEIDRIMEEGFEEENFTGINYMKIGLDFVVG